MRLWREARAIAKHKLPVFFGKNPVRASWDVAEVGIEVSLRGGLGNQLFCYSAGLNVASRLGVPLRLVTKAYSGQQAQPRFFELGPIIGREVLTGDDYFSARLFRERGFAYDSRVEMVRSGTLLDGYFQSSKYFRPSQEKIRGQVTSSRPFVRGRRLLGSEPFIALQVRRGDYTSSTNLKIYGLLPTDFFRQSLKVLRGILGSLPAVVFSDDPQTARQVACSLENAKPYHTEARETSLQVMGALSSAEGLCISNSSFGWWAAYLAEKRPPIIAPRPWFLDRQVDTGDLLESSWMTLGFEPGAN